MMKIKFKMIIQHVNWSAVLSINFNSFSWLLVCWLNWIIVIIIFWKKYKICIDLLLWSLVLHVDVLVFILKLWPQWWKSKILHVSCIVEKYHIVECLLYCCFNFFVFLLLSVDIDGILRWWSTGGILHWILHDVMIHWRVVLRCILGKFVLGCNIIWRGVHFIYSFVCNIGFIITWRYFGPVSSNCVFCFLFHPT